MKQERSSHSTYKESPQTKKHEDSYFKEVYRMIKGRVLDLGSGTGIFWEKFIIEHQMGKLLSYVIGIDKVREKYLFFDEKVMYLEHDLEAGLPKMTAKFDVVLAMDTYESTDISGALETVMAGIKDVLSTDGFFMGSFHGESKIAMQVFLDKHFYVYDVWKKNDSILWRAGKPKFKN